MKPAPFAYHAPESLEDVLGLAAEYGATARVLAGGQSLIPLLNARRIRVEHLIDLNGVASLDHLEETEGVLSVGALARQARAITDATVRRTAPLLAEALAQSANPSVRSRGTICGNLAFAQPTAELPAVALAMGGDVTVRRVDSERRIGLEEFFIGPFSTALRPGEVVTEVRFARWPESAGHALVRVSRMRIPILSAAALIQLDSGTVSRCAVALAGVSDTPVRAPNVESILTGVEPMEETIAQAALLATDGFDVPHDGALATTAYRIHVAHVLVRNVLSQAVGRAMALEGVG